MRCRQAEAPGWVGGYGDSLGGKWDCEPGGERGGWQGGPRVQTDWGGETGHTERGGRGHSRCLGGQLGGGTGVGQRGARGTQKSACLQS